MTTHIAFLRGVNVGGQGKVAMSDLKELGVSLGFGDVRTLLNSGNFIFATEAETTAQLEELLELEAARRLRLQTDFMIRTAAELSEIVARNPFPDEAGRDPSHLLVMFLKTAPEPGAVEKLQAAVTGPEVIRAAGRELYVTYPAGIGSSKLTTALMDAKLRVSGTGRNWNTVLKLSEFR